MPTPSSEPACGIAFVVPVWNDSSRLASYGPQLAAELAARRLPVRWIIADDGSDAEERPVLERLRREFSTIYPAVELYHAATHRGKGGVIRAAWSTAPEAGWLAFADADGSVSAAEMLDLIESALATGRSTLGVRVRTATTRVESSVRREFLHHAYLWLARVWLGLSSADLQCGAKVIRADGFRAVAPMLREDGWAFDSELLMALRRRGGDWREIPVNWTARCGGKVRPFRDGFQMIAALRRIRGRWRR